MALRKLSDSRLLWAIFAPLALLLWLIIGLMVWYTITNEKALRRDMLEAQLKNVNATILEFYEQGADLQKTLEFIDAYNDNTTFNDLRITVYSAYGEVLAHIGAVIRIEDDSHRMIPELVIAENEGQATGVRPNLVDARPSIFNAMTSNDGGIRTISAIVYNPSVVRALTYNSMIWALVIVLAIGATVAIFLVARKVNMAAKSLHEFASRAAAGERINAEALKFPNDELGDVSREIIRLYRDKDRANRRLEHEHQVALRANEEKARIKRQTANNLNHELKTPVGIIKGYLDTINSDPGMPESLRNSFLKKAQEHADRLTQLLKDVSSITRLDEGAQQVEITDFDFHDLVYNIAADLEVSHINEGLEFDWQIPFDTVVKGNYTLLNNAIMNLVRNAAKYSRGTRITLRKIKEDDTTYTFSFADDGVGVGEEHLEHLFERFYRIDEGRARKSGGTGLGLPIVKSTFQALGGDVIVQNAKPHGLEFIFTLKKGKIEPQNL